MKRILITSTDLMMIQFLVPHVQNLASHGWQVEIACSQVGGRLEEVKRTLQDSVQAVHQVRLVRSPASPGNFRGYADMKNLLRSRKYDLIWTNEPVMGVVTRLAARRQRRQGTKVVYMVHGFHFFKGSSPLMWAAFYPVERLMAHFCDAIITINREDEARAKTFSVPRVGYIHGIGMNTERLHQRDARSNIRRELGLSDRDFLVLSVGELNENKNQRVIVEAVARLRDPRIHYAICGKGACLEQLQNLAETLGIGDRVHFLGYRRDVVDICAQADVFAHPSRREGLSVASLEAMYCGLALVVSRVRGAGDYLEHGKSGYLCDADDVQGFAEAIRTLAENPALCRRFGEYNRQAVQPYCVDRVRTELLSLLETIREE